MPAAAAAAAAAAGFGMYQPAVAAAAPALAYCLFVYNLPPDADEGLLYRLFGPFGAISDVKIMRETTTNRCKVCRRREAGSRFFLFPSLLGRSCLGRILHIPEGFVFGFLGRLDAKRDEVTATHFGLKLDLPYTEGHGKRWDPTGRAASVLVVCTQTIKMNHGERMGSYVELCHTETCCNLRDSKTER
jgi:hypothetical protein